MLNNPDQFNKFYLAKYFKEAIELYGPDELYNLMEHKLENARFKGYGAMILTYVIMLCLFTLKC